MRRIVAAFAVAVSPILFVSPARAAEDLVCKELAGLEKTRMAELAADIAVDQALEKRLLEGALANEKAAAAKEEQAKKFKAAADATTDPKKKKAYLDIVALLEGGANRDKQFAKELKEGAAKVAKAQHQAEESLEARTAALLKLRVSCNLASLARSWRGAVVLSTPCVLLTPRFRSSRSRSRCSASRVGRPARHRA